jgi:hypothetical protein
LRVLGGVCFRGSFEFELFFAFSFGLPLFLPFVGFTFFPLLDDLFELFFGFWSSSCASCALGFKIQSLYLCVVNVLIKGEIEKASGPWFDL